METIAQWLMDDYGVINSLDVFCLLVLSFLLLYIVVKITENLIWPVVAFNLVIVAMIFTVYITAKSDILYWSSCAGHFYLRIFILQWAHPIVGCMRPFKIVIMNELRDFLFNSVFIHSRSVT